MYNFDRRNNIGYAEPEYLRFRDDLEWQEPYARPDFRYYDEYQDVCLYDNNDCQFDMRYVNNRHAGYPTRGECAGDRFPTPEPCRGNAGRPIRYHDRFPVPDSRGFYPSGFENDSEHDWHRFEADERNTFQGRYSEEEFVEIREFERSREIQAQRYDYNLQDQPGRDWRERQYQNESFINTVQQLNQEPHVYLPDPPPPPPPPEPVADFVPPPNKMYRGRGYWRNYHQNHFSHERDDRPYRRRRSHLDDIYLPNYEDNDESDDISVHHRERFESKRPSRWDVRNKSPYMGHRKDIWKRCLISTTQASTSNDYAGGKGKTSEESEDTAPNKPCVVTKAAVQTIGDKSKENTCNSSKNDYSTDECDKLKDSKMKLCSNSEEKEKENQMINNTENSNEPHKQTKEIFAKISEVKDNGAVVQSIQPKTNTNTNKYCERVHAKPTADISSAISTMNPETVNVLKKLSTDIEKSNISKQDKTADECSTNETSPKGAALDTSLEIEFDDALIIDEDFHERPISKNTRRKPVSDEWKNEEQDVVMCHTLPSEFPTWERSPISKYQNPYMSIREIESDEETICYDDFITLDSIDTTRSYLREHLGPDYDDLRVVDMAMSTPSPDKRKYDEDEDFVSKKTKYERLYAEINSDQLLSEINEVLREDKQISDSTAAKCTKRHRSNSLNLVPPKEHVAPPRRSRSLHLIDQNHLQDSFDFDTRTNLLLLLGNTVASSIEIDISDGHRNDVKCSNVPAAKQTDKRHQHPDGKAVESDRAETDKNVSSSNNVCKENEKECVMAKERVKKDDKLMNSCNNSGDKKEEIEQVTEGVKEKVNGPKTEIVVEKDKGVAETLEDAAPIKSNLRKTVTTEQVNAQVSSENVSSTKSGAENPVRSKTEQSKHKGQISKENGPKSSDKAKRTTEDRKKERRPNDEAKKVPGIVSDAPGTSDNSKSKSLVRYSDYKKSVDLSKKTSPPKINLCKNMGDSPKKETSGPTAFSNEEELCLTKIHMWRDLFGSDFEDEDEKSDNKRRKCETDVNTDKKELSSKSNAQRISKVKRLDETMRDPIPSTSTDESDRRNTVEVTKNTHDRQSSSNTQRTSSSTIGKSKQSKDSHRISYQSKNIDKNRRRTSTASKPSEGVKKRIPNGITVSQKVQTEKCDKPDENRNNSKQDTGDSSTAQSSDTSKEEKCKLNVDSGKSQAREIINAKKPETQTKGRRQEPKMVVENTTKKCHKNSYKFKSSKVIDNRTSTPRHKNTAKGNNNLNIMPDNVQGEKQNPAIVQKPKDNDTQSNKSAVFQPKLVLKRIDDKIVQAKVLPMKRPILSTIREPKYETSTALAKDRFPMMQKIRFTISENECCDMAVVLESSDVRNDIEAMRQPVATNKDRKDTSDDVIEIKPDIPVIDLTEDVKEVKNETVEHPPKTELVLKSDESEQIDVPVDKSISTVKSKTSNGEERITLYRSDETLNSCLEVQAMVASLAPNALINKDGNKSEIIKSDDTDKEEKDKRQLSVPGISPLHVPQDRSALSDLLIEQVINEVLTQQEQQNPEPNITVKKTNDITRTVCTSGTYLPQHSVLKTTLCRSSATAYQNTTTADSDKSMPPPLHPAQGSPRSSYPAQRSPTVQSPRRLNDVTNASITVQNTRQIDSDKIGLPHRTPNADAQSRLTITQFLTQYPTQQVSGNNTTRGKESNTSEQNFGTATNSQAPQQIDSTMPLTKFNVVLGNRAPVNTSNSQNLYNHAPGSTRVESNTRMDFNLVVDAENNSTAQNVLMAQTSRRSAVANGQMSNNVTQNSRVESSSNEQNVFVGRSDSQVPVNTLTCAPSGAYIASRVNVNEHMTVNVAGQSTNNADGPLRPLRQLRPELSLENAEREASRTISLLERYLYYYDGLKRAQLAYCNELKKMSCCLPDQVKTDIAVFERINTNKLYNLSKELVGTLKTYNLYPTFYHFSKVQCVLQTVFNRLQIGVPTLTMSLLYLMLEALMKPEEEQYLNVPPLAALYSYVGMVVSQIRNRTMPEQNQKTNQNNVPQRDLFTAEQRKLLEWQMQQYKIINNNQVVLFSRGNLQSNLLKAHQNNMNAKANQQSKAPAAIDVQTRQQSGASVTQYDIPGPPNVIIAPPVVRNPSAAQMPTPNSEPLSNVLSVNSSKKPGQHASQGRATNQAPIPPDLGAASVDVVSNPTVTAAIPRRNQPKPKSIAKNLRRNSSPSMLQHKTAPPKASSEITNENFRIRLPFTVPYDIRSSPAHTVSVAQNSPRSVPQNSNPVSFTVPHSGAGQFMPSQAQNSGASTTSALQNPGTNPSVHCEVRNSGAIASMRYTVHHTGVTPSMSSRVPNPSSTPSMPSPMQNPVSTPSTQSPIQNPGSNMSRSSLLQNPGATPFMSPRVENPGATPSMPSMPLLDEDRQSGNVPNLSHIQSAMKSPVYTPIPLNRHVVLSPPPPPVANEQPNPENQVITIEDDKDVLEIKKVQEVPSVSNQSTNEAVKNKDEQQPMSEGIETIDLTWLDDVDPEQLQNEIEFIAIKKEEILDDEVPKVGGAQDAIGGALSPTDSGISSPNVQMEYNEQVFSDRMCICGKGAEYVCGCMMAMYCSESCQLKDWKTHKEVCLKHNAKGSKDTA